jgi:FkbM family methyltransferase
MVDQPAQAISLWQADYADPKRFDYPLTEDSIVFDVGGYKGDWACRIAEKYNPYIYVFEPVPCFCHVITERFKGNPKVFVFNFGLLDKMKTGAISVDGTRSSLYTGNANKIMARFVEFGLFLTPLSIKSIDLISINVEGAEYPLLKYMIDQGLVSMFQDILIQFHTFYPEAEKHRNEIRESLENTHFLTFDYPFVWENWRKKAA